VTDPGKLSDEQLLDFDHDGLVDFDLARAEQALAGQREAFRPQLVMARWIDGWRERMAEREAGSIDADDPPETWQDGFDYAVRHLTEDLRRGAFLPGGLLHSEEDGGRR